MPARGQPATVVVLWAARLKNNGWTDACTGAALQLRCGESGVFRQADDAGCPVPDVEDGKAVKVIPVFSATRDYTARPDY
jgi:hypothetical protein